MREFLSEHALAALVGIGGGLLLGLAARLGRFCTLGAIEDLSYAGDGNRARMWLVAMGAAILGTSLLAWAGWFEPARSIYITGWNPIAAVLGGLMFGYGMALAGNCGYGALARFGGGDLRSFVIVLVMGLAAYATISGPLAALRVAAFPPILPEAGSLADMASRLTGLDAALLGTICGALVLGAAILAGSIASRGAILWGCVVAAAIVSAWAGTAWIARTGFEDLPVVSHTFAAPLGETMLYTMTSSGNRVSFGIGSVMGVLAGAFIGSLIKGHFRWEACEDPRELTRQIGGAALMGVGAVLALGCSIGQGLSAMSVLAPSAPIVAICIYLGARLGLRQLIEGFRTV